MIAPEDIDSDTDLTYTVRLGHLETKVEARSPLHAIELARAEWQAEWKSLYTDIFNKHWNDFEVKLWEEK